MIKRTYWQRNTATDGYLLRRDVSRVLGNFLMVVLLFGLCFLILQPLLHQLSNTFMSRDDLFDPTVIAIPRYPTTEHFRLGLELMYYWQSLWRTLAITFSMSLLQISACTLVAYGFARFNFPGKRFWFVCVMITILIPPHILRSAMFINFRFFEFFGFIPLFTGGSVNLLDTLQGYTLLSATAMGLRNGLYIFILRQYFRNMPKELEEAAWVDGCGKLRTFAQIMLPDAVPVLMSCFLFAFVWQWTDGFYAGMFLRSFGMMAEQMAGLGDYFASWYVVSIGAAEGGLMLAPIALVEVMVSVGVLLGIAPLILVYLFAQRYFVESIGQSGIKM
ncbi:MAG: carbohydrate ABC transporter permease [Defluviitaleaceae bacterium]|nr:carbohydrate ABC transporter permease [Defluviitaleaceae bacterium]